MSKNFTSETIRQAGLALRGPLTIELSKCGNDDYANAKIKEIAFKADMNDSFCDLIISAAEYIIANLPTEENMESALKEFCDFVPKHRAMILKEDPNAFTDESLTNRICLAQKMEMTRIMEEKA